MNEHNKPPLDLNAKAMDEFRNLVTMDTELDIAWRDALLAITADGIPDAIDSLQVLAKGGNHAETQNSKG